MDGLSALSVAASVAQFIEFGCSLVSKSHQIYKSTRGLSVQHAETENATNRLLELNTRLTISLDIDAQSGSYGPRDSTSIREICRGCVDVSGELLKRLDKLRLSDDKRNRHWKSFRQALKSVWSKGAIDEIAKRLQSYKAELDAHILVSLSERFNRLTILQTENFTSLDRNMQESIETLLRTLIKFHQRLETVLESQAGSIGQRLQHRLTDAYADQMALQLDDKTASTLLQSLRFPTMTHRGEEIAEAHKRTFEWAFRAPENGYRPWSDFVEWLQTGGQLYWINGKAGSGKSTLMRYVYENNLTHQYLQAWAGNADLRVAAFFFWNSGCAEQRSLEGLLRSLLFKILRCRQDLIRIAFEPEWTDVRALLFAHRESPDLRWSYKRLETALRRLTSLASERLKMCFFIDGVDEYDGDHEAIVEFFKEVTESPYVKICLSSRPWLAFTDTLKEYPGLRLQDLTSNDIRLYTFDKLETNSKMMQLAKPKPEAAATFVKEIVMKANGVFLWVELVVKSLLNGLRNRDDISDLRQRLEELPSDLDDLYRHLLDKIEPRYMEQANRTFEIYNSASEINPRMTILELELALNATYAESISTALEEMTDDEIESRCEIMTSHLSSRCAGFLEVHDIMDRAWESLDSEPRYSKFRTTPHAGVLRSLSGSAIQGCGHSPNVPPQEFGHSLNALDQISQQQRSRFKLDLKVSYLHRTVKDFLNTDIAHLMLERHILSKVRFDPNMALFMSYIISFKRSICPFYVETDDMTWKSVKEALTFATKTTQGPESCPAILLEELCRSGYQLWREEVKSKSGTWDIDFLIVAIRLGFSAYVDERLKKLKNLPRGPDGSPLLCYALRSPVHELTNPLPPQPVFPSVVEVLLEHGADPNEEWSRTMPSGVSIWQRVLRFVHDEDTRSKIHGPDVLGGWARIIKAMLRERAKVDTTCDERHCVGVVDYEEFHSAEYQKIYAAQSHTVASVIRDSFSDQLPAEEAILLQMVSANKAVKNKKAKRKRGLSPERRASKKANRRELSKATNAIE